MKIVLCVALILLGLVASGNGAYRILGVFPAPAYSHYALGSRLMKALAEKGHDVTMISPFKEKSPPKFYREIVLEEILKESEGNNRVNNDSCIKNKQHKT